MIWPHGQEVKTPPSQGGITGPIPVEATIYKRVYEFCKLAYSNLLSNHSKSSFLKSSYFAIPTYFSKEGEQQ